MADLTQSGAPHPARHPSDPDTTGHEWDGIQEFNNPLPRWWLWTLYGTIVWALIYMVLYPAMPLLNDYTRGFWEYSQRGNVLDDVEKARSQRLAQAKGLAEASLAQIKADPDMLRMAMASGKAAFGDNCAACHGTGATGRTGYPNLQDDEWLWGGTLEDIHQTLRVGIRSTHLETRMGDMPSFGTSGVLKDNEIEAVAQYVLSLSRQPLSAKADLKLGGDVFKQQCAACHGDDGKGKPELGSPNLTDAIWLYGNTPQAITATIVNGRKGVMPHWEGRLDPVTIKSLAVYVHSLGGGK